MNKNIIIAGAIAIGVYLLSQGKAIFSAAAQKVDISRLPVAQIRYMISHAAALKKTREEVTALKAEEARRVARSKAAYKAAQKRIGVPISRTAYIAARRKAAQKVDISRLPVAQIRYMISHAAALKKTREEVTALKAEEARRVARSKAAVRKAAAQKIGKKIGKMVAQKIPLNVKTRRAVIAWHAKRQRPQIQRPNPNKKRAGSKLFPGAERSRIIPYSESRKHSYYGPKSHKLQNEGYAVEWQKRYKNSVEAYDNAREMEVLRNRKPWQR